MNHALRWGAVLAAAILALACGTAPDEAPRGAADEAAVGAPAAPEATTPRSARPATQIETRPVTIYGRAQDESFLLVGRTAQIVWFGSAADRGRQIVSLVLDSDAGSVPGGVVCTEVHLDDRGTMWVDLARSSLGSVRGSDEEQALVACLARSLVEALDEVDRVGVLIDGEPRRTLAGHVDLSRTFTGAEWPTRGDLATALPGGEESLP